MEIGKEVFEFKEKAYFPDSDEIKLIDLKNYRGKWVLLTFYPGDFTFVCATDIEALMEKFSEFESEGIAVFVISADTVFSHKGWVQASPRVSKSKIPMIEDPKKEVITNYGFLNSETGGARRGMVIIDPDGKLQYYSIFNDALGKDIGHIMFALKGLKAIYNAIEVMRPALLSRKTSKSTETVKTMDVDTVKDIGKL
ncbi:redoxin domain-containing protein [Candidatus Parvarchaeota archaeon]|nr:redoxin domain-containing protein [Candidatus Parvarchaeota archaeon]